MAFLLTLLLFITLNYWCTYNAEYAFLILIDYFQSSSKKYFEDFCTTLESREVDLMRKIFNERSILFLGCDPERPEYKNFFQKFAVNAKVDSCWNLQSSRWFSSLYLHVYFTSYFLWNQYVCRYAPFLQQLKHYKFETYQDSDLHENGNLITLKANIQPWEFVQFLSTGTIQEEIQPGQVT